MFAKTIAAIYFSKDSILVCELDAGRRKIKKSASVTLPEGIISSKGVLDKKKLALILKEFWNKNSIKSKDVGIIVPEFSTFTKLITLPKLAASEMGEAVNWQAQEYLPAGIENMVLDWKVLTKGESGIEVLMVAVNKRTLMDYVDPCVKAGLFPVAVETPSISIGNIIKSGDGFIALMMETDQTLIITGEKNKVFGTSVINNGGVEEVVTSIAKIIKHYNKVQFKNIYIGGEGVSTQIIENLKTTFKLGIVILDPVVGGNKADLQKYLVPISMLKNPVAEPLDPSTLNLLPKDLVGKYQNQKIKNQVWSLTLTVTVFVWVSLLIVLGSFMVLTQQVATLKTQSQKTAQVAAERKKAETEAAAVNKVLEDVLKIKNTTIAPATILNLIFTAKPPGVLITIYELDLDNGEVNIRGVSPDRQSLVAFKENLEKIENIRSVNIPISNFEEVANLTYSVDFVYGGQNQKPTPVVKGK